MWSRFISAVQSFPWRGVLARLPLPMLALAASWGVYSFSLLFVPPWVAVVQAAAFELVYIGLAVVELDRAAQRRARAISIGAVLVSMIYNSLEGLFVRRPELLVNPPLWFDISLALLHGVPLALLAYLVADLLLHQNPTEKPQNSIEASPRNYRRLGASKIFGASPGRPKIHTFEALAEFAGVMAFSREQLMQGLGCSATAADRLLSDGVGSGRLVKLDRGLYQVEIGAV